MSFADSFGLVMGQSSSTLNTVKDDAAPPGTLRLLNVSEASANYKTYLGQFSDEQGLCWVKGIGIDIHSDKFGTEVRAAFTTEKMRLIEIYGEPKDFDFRFTGRTDSDLDSWLQAISLGDRFVASIWGQEAGAELAEGLQSVGLVINGSTANIGYLSLEYTFGNIKACEKELELLE